eukprot:TRINITY_DN15015_c0_g1_i1.p1 TRINITY_DN15015_c0_g1~~TRINITY_DN15015_c0_g1_i1.p1  ORF type:complete len:155 (-),score=36.44 TRINITY_DN15015_c0_g1_i1:21-485(-)
MLQLSYSSCHLIQFVQDVILDVLKIGFHTHQHGLRWKKNEEDQKPPNQNANPLTQEQQFAFQLQTMLMSMEANFQHIQNNVLDKLDQMTGRIAQLEHSMQVIMDKAGIDTQQLQEQVNQEIEQIENLKKLTLQPPTSQQPSQQPPEQPQPPTKL